ncbi:ECF-type sigma factor [Gemmatimonas sp.]|uniref:ECF-type sigma factor n=1 Tax=Gemmatimonas sp. TaxID=1962908 RepID=UPI00286DF2C4|nr:ECF-type sigma factor [Gemmatimonas sp.]
MAHLCLERWRILIHEADTSPHSAQAIRVLAERCYDDLRDLAHRERRRNADLHTLDTSSLVHEAFLRLITQRQLASADRPQFLAAAAVTIRRVIIDHVRALRAEKRGGGFHPITLDGPLGVVEMREDMLLALDEALEQLSRVYPRLVRVVECRYFSGMTEEDTAEALGVTARTVRRDWVKARGWLHMALDL